MKYSFYINEYSFGYLELWQGLLLGFNFYFMVLPALWLRSDDDLYVGSQ